ncbi:GntR family transcriptional regulator (plasmid) [Sphingomonas panni]|uniref:GntR family transcriptional regulator n=1 Tax=Sphingomonas hankookensis TaxID=563996 RepID=UPI003D3036A4
MGRMEVTGIRQQIADRLRADIIAGALAPNQKVTEEALAHRFGVSRGPIRDVLLELSMEGLLVTRANRDTRVNDVAAPEVQTMLVKLRLDIETYALQRVAQNPSGEFLQRLREALHDLSMQLRAGNFAEVTKADIAFHRLIVHEAGGDDLVNLWQPIIMRLRMNHRRLASPDQAIVEHEQIVAAIGAGKGAAAVTALKTNVR